MTATPAKRAQRRRPESGPVAAPSRMRSKRQHQIVQMVKGYDATFTFSVALRNVFVLWTLYGFALILVSALALSTDPLSESAATNQGILEAVRTGSLLLFLFTFVMTGGWVAKSVANVERLGRKASMGVLARFRSHFLGFCLGVVALLFSALIPEFSAALVVVAVGMLFYAQMWIHLTLLDVVKMLWRSSSPLNEQHEEADHYVLIWFWSWMIFLGLLAADVSPTSLSDRTVAGLLMVAGAACAVSALLASRLVMAISERQDARLFAIIHEVDDSQEDKLVTDSDIAAAWNRSASFIEMPR